MLHITHAVSKLIPDQHKLAVTDCWPVKTTLVCVALAIAFHWNKLSAILYCLHAIHMCTYPKQADLPPARQAQLFISESRHIRRERRVHSHHWKESTLTSLEGEYTHIIGRRVHSHHWSKQAAWQACLTSIPESLVVLEFNLGWFDGQYELPVSGRRWRRQQSSLDSFSFQL